MPTGWAPACGSRRDACRSTCTPQRCEVVQLGGGAGLAPAAATLGVVVVGRAERSDPHVVSGPFDTGGVPLLLAGDVNGLSQLAALQLFGRTYAWVVALDADRVLASGVPGYIALSGQVADAITAQVPSTSVFRPDSALQAQNTRAGLSTRRFGLLGGSAAVLLLGFAALAAVSLRRGHRLLVTVLRRRGADPGADRRAHRGAVRCRRRARRRCSAARWVRRSWQVLAVGADIPAARTAGHALAAAAAGCAVLMVAAAAIAVAVLLCPPDAGRPVRQALDVIAVACILAAVLAADRGSTDLSARLRPAGDRAAGSARRSPAASSPPGCGCRPSGSSSGSSPRRSLAGRLGLLGGVRRPLRPVTTVALLAAAVAAVVFAGGYRATLLAGAADEAAYAIPLDARLTTGNSLVQPVTTAAALPNGDHRLRGHPQCRHRALPRRQRKQHSDRRRRPRRPAQAARWTAPPARRPRRPVAGRLTVPAPAGAPTLPAGGPARSASRRGLRGRRTRSSRCPWPGRTASNAE